MNLTSPHQKKKKKNKKGELAARFVVSLLTALPMSLLLLRRALFSSLTHSAPFCLLQMASTWSPKKLKRQGMSREDLLAVVRAHVSEAVADSLPEWVNADVLTTAKRMEMWDDIRDALPGIDSASFVKLKLLGNREALKHEDEREEATVGRLLQRIPQAAQSTPQQPTTSGATLVGTKQARERGRAGRPRGPETPAARRCTTAKVFPTLCSPLHRRDYMAGVVIEDSEDFCLRPRKHNRAARDTHDQGDRHRVADHQACV